jgi:alkylation response protein AidB-like acyl-CoA dehydrogenase
MKPYDYVEVKTSREFNQRELIDILVTAFEGGTGYWARIEGYTIPDGAEALDDGDTKDKLPRHAWVPLYEGGYIRLTVPEDGDGKVYNYGFSTLRYGLELIEQAYPKRFAALSSGDFDAEDADVVVQLGLFGKIVYG